MIRDYSIVYLKKLLCLQSPYLYPSDIFLSRLTRDLNCIVSLITTLARIIILR